MYVNWNQNKDLPKSYEGDEHAEWVKSEKQRKLLDSHSEFVLKFRITLGKLLFVNFFA